MALRDLFRDAGGRQAHAASRGLVACRSSGLHWSVITGMLPKPPTSTTAHGRHDDHGAALTDAGFNIGRDIPGERPRPFRNTRCSYPVTVKIEPVNHDLGSCAAVVAGPVVMQNYDHSAELVNGPMSSDRPSE